MQSAIELFGNLVLTFLGFVTPIVGFILSIYQEGTLILKNQYQSERKQAEENIKSQLKKIAEREDDNLEENEIKINLNKLRDIKRIAEERLSFLDPKKQIFKLFLPFTLSFFLVEVALFTTKNYQKVYNLNISYAILFFILALCSFIYAIKNLWLLSLTIIDVKKIFDNINIEKQQSIIKTLTNTIKNIEKNKEESLLKKIFIFINDKKIKDKLVEIELKTQEKKELHISLNNNEKRMAKNIEMGFVFPKEFIVETEDSSFSIYNDGKSQVIRKEILLLHGNTNLILSNLNITPLTKGRIKIKTFIKAENMEVKYDDLYLNII